MRFSRKSVLVVTVLTFIGIVAVVGWFILSPQFQLFNGRFGIYLSETNKLVISDEEIVSYNRTSHEIKLTQEGVERIKALQVSLYGTPFVVKINGEEVCNGSFVTPISSIPIPPSEIVIETLVQNDTINMQKGYPPSQSGDQDARNNSRIFDYFQKIGKLVS